MPVTLTLALVVAFSFLVSRLLQRYAPRRSGFGTAYLLLGVLLGPEVARLLGPEELSVLQPFVSVTLGVTGFLLGLPLAKRLQSVAVFEAGLLSTVLTAMGVTVFTAIGLTSFAGTQDPQLPALTLGAASAATSLLALRSAAERFGAAGRVTVLVESIALVGNVLAVLVSGLALALAGADANASRLGLDQISWLFASVGLGVPCGLLFHFFVRAEESEERVFLATVGVIVFASGMASGMGISTLFLNALAGVTVALAAGKTQDHSVGLERLERPTFVVLMIFAGAMWTPAGWGSLIAPIGFFAVRLLVVRLAAWLSAWIIPRVETVPRLGNGLIPLGGVATAIGVNYAQVGLPEKELVLNGILGAVVLAEAFATPGLRRLWVDAGEVSELVPPLSGSPR